MHRQVAAEVLGVAPELVRIDVAGTDGPYDEGVRAQRGTHVEGTAVFNAATSLIDSLRREAARLWQVKPGQGAMAPRPRVFKRSQKDSRS